MNTPNQGLILAIDIGTNNSCASFINPYTGVAEAIEVDDSISVPSFFGYNKYGEEIIGEAAKKEFGNGISEVIGRAKYLVGKEIHRNQLEALSDMCGTEVLTNQDGFCYFHLPKKGIDILPGELYKRMIRLFLSKLEEKRIGHAEFIRITVPAAFDANQRILIKQIAEECGFQSDHISLLNEPSAAAYMYWHTRKPMEGRFIVYDFGGGTFDISLVGIIHGQLEVLDYGGDSNLGGCDIDKAIANEYLTEIEGGNYPVIKKETPGNIRKRIMGKLLLRCEQAKICLCNNNAGGQRAEIGLENSMTSNEGELDAASDILTSRIDMSDVIFVSDEQDDEENNYEYTLTEVSLKALSQPFIDKTIDLLRQLLERNNLTADSITNVIVVGGSSLLPSIRSSLERIFSPNQILDTISPKEVVSFGACYSLYENNGLKERSTYSLGVELEKKIQWLIPKNVPLPYEYECTTYNTEDYQTFFVTNLVQGNSEEVKLSKKKNIVRLGTIFCDTRTQDEKGKVSFKITYKFESDGCVYVSIWENNSNSSLFAGPLSWNSCDVCSSNGLSIGM